MKPYPHRPRLALVVMSLVAVACGSSAQSAAPSVSSPSPVASASNSPQPSTQPTGASQSSQPSATAAGNGGTGAVPSLANGDWKSGKAHAVVSGDVTATVDGEIKPGLATTLNDNTSLIYFSADGVTQIAVAIAGGVAAVSVISPAFVAGAGTTIGAPCQANFTKADATSVEGTITCRGAPVLEQGAATAKKADIEASFNATR
jgi:hypothetical protein